MTVPFIRQQHPVEVIVLRRRQPAKEQLLPTFLVLCAASVVRRAAEGGAGQMARLLADSTSSIQDHAITLASTHLYPNRPSLEGVEDVAAMLRGLREAVMALLNQALAEQASTLLHQAAKGTMGMAFVIDYSFGRGSPRLAWPGLRGQMAQGPALYDVHQPVALHVLPDAFCTDSADTNQFLIRGMR